MAATLSASPVRYHPSVETHEADEAETIQGLVDTLHRISETIYKDTGHAPRSVHSKSHGLLRGELRVLDDLPEPLRQGIFATPGAHPVVMRFSTTPAEILDDNVSTPRGLALKVIGVEGERLPGAAGRNQDFVLVDGPVFGAPNAKKFLGVLKLLAATTDKAPGLKRVLSTVLRGAEAAVEAVGGKSGTLIALGGHPETHVLGETYYSQAPLRHGDYIAKVAVAPASPDLQRLTGAAVDLSGKPNGLREATADFFRTHGGEWEVKVQLCTDLDKMPIEDATVRWSESESPYVTVARVVVPSQEAWSEARAAEIDEGMAFSPWNGLLAHQPLGSVMRARKAAYEMSSRFRAEHNGVSIAEPADPKSP